MQAKLQDRDFALVCIRGGERVGFLGAIKSCWDRDLALSELGSLGYCNMKQVRGWGAVGHLVWSWSFQGFDAIASEHILF